MKYLVKKGHVSETLFSDDMAMKSKRMYGNNSQEILKSIETNPREFVYIGAGTMETIVRYYLDVNGQHPFYESKDTLSASFTGFFFKKGSLYQENFNFYMAKMWANGIIKNQLDNYDHGTERFYLQQAEKKKRFGPPSPSKKIKLIHMSCGFIIMATGFTVSFAILVLEKVIPKEWVEKYKLWMGELDERCEPTENNRNPNDKSREERNEAQKGKIMHQIDDEFKSKQPNSNQHVLRSTGKSKVHNESRKNLIQKAENHLGSSEDQEMTEKYNNDDGANCDGIIDIE